MKTAVLAIDATRDTPQAIENISRGMIRFQTAGLFDEVHVVSVIHPDSYLLPYSFYRDEKYKLAEQAKLEVRQKLDPELKVSSSEVLVTDGQSMEEHVQLLDRFAKSVEADVVVVGTNDKSTLSYLVQGSFAEATSLNTTLPVLVFGSTSGVVRFSRPPTILVALSPTNLPNESTRKWIVNLARALKANISLQPVNDQSRWLSADWEIDRETAEMIRREFVMEGILSVSVLTKEPAFPGQIPSIADQEQALLTIFCSTPSTLKKPIFAPSLNGRVIAEMARPILTVKEISNDSWDESRRRNDQGFGNGRTSRLDDVRQRVNEHARHTALAGNGWLELGRPDQRP